jgi:hypothetical protein
MTINQGGWEKENKMSIKVNTEQLVSVIQVQFANARHELAKLEITEEQWDAIVNLFGEAEEYAYRLIRATEASGEFK